MENKSQNRRKKREKPEEPLLYLPKGLLETFNFKNFKKSNEYSSKWIVDFTFLSIRKRIVLYFIRQMSLCASIIVILSYTKVKQFDWILIYFKSFNNKHPWV